MQLIKPPDSFYVSAAMGWIGLGNITEAKAELARLGLDLQSHPDVLEVRWMICAEEKSWEEALRIAQALLAAAPERCTGWLYQAYALRRVPGGSIKRAWDALLPAFDKFPKEATICFNLSCYACQLGLLDAARIWFKRARVIGGSECMKKQALDDPDMAPLWDEIRGG